MMRVLYVVAGLALLGATGLADVRGWLTPRPSPVANVPRSIRDNPGAYRSLYNGSPRYFGGK